MDAHLNKRAGNDCLKIIRFITTTFLISGTTIQCIVQLLKAMITEEHLYYFSYYIAYLNTTLTLLDTQFCFNKNYYKLIMSKTDLHT